MCTFADLRMTNSFFRLRLPLFCDTFTLVNFVRSFSRKSYPLKLLNVNLGVD